MSGSLSKRSDLANDNSCVGPGPTEDAPTAKWLKDGQNQQRRATQRDQNRNELRPPRPAQLELAARNARNAAGGARPPLIPLRDGDEDEDEEDEGDGDSTPVQSDPNTGDSEPSGERGPREPPRSASRLFGVRSGTASDEDSSWATLSQGSPGSSPDDADSFWTRNSFETDADLPAGWLRVQDTSGTYYWHVPTGTTQWQPPPGLPQGSAPGSPESSRCQDPPVRTGTGVCWGNPGVRGPRGHRAVGTVGLWGPRVWGCGFPRGAGRWGPWVCGDPRVQGSGDHGSVGTPGCRAMGTVGLWGPQVWGCGFPRGAGRWGPWNRTLKLLDPQDQALLHAQPVAAIRVWGVGRDSGRDFAFVARDPLTQMLKCHVFRCESPARNIASSLHEVCAQVRQDPR
ncbi:APBB1 protein, partial [Columbina picui]|nr:APBB1 protein [Columbina picui]